MYYPEDLYGCADRNIVSQQDINSFVDGTLNKLVADAFTYTYSQDVTSLCCQIILEIKKNAMIIYDSSYFDRKKIRDGLTSLQRRFKDQNTPHMQEIIRLENIISRMVNQAGYVLECLPLDVNIKIASYLNATCNSISLLKMMYSKSYLYENVLPVWVESKKISIGMLFHLASKNQIENSSMLKSFVGDLRVLMKRIKSGCLVSDFSLNKSDVLAIIPHLHSFRASSLLIGKDGITGADGFNLKLLMSCSNIRELKLCCVNLLNFQSIKHLDRLCDLEIGGCTLGKGDFCSISKLENLQRLSLSGQAINDDELVFVKYLKNLKELDVTFCNKIKDTWIEAIDAVNSMTRIGFRRWSGLTNTGLKSISKLTNLKSLSLIECPNITDCGLEWLEKLTKLQSLYLYKCYHITDKGLESVGRLINLQKLDLTGIKMTDVGVKHFKNLLKLYYLDLSGCNVVTSEGCKSLQNLVSLEAITLKGIFISEVSLKELKKVESLIHLYLETCMVADYALLAAMPNLLRLDFSCITLSAHELRQLAPLTRLQALRLFVCKITDDAIEALPVLPKLKWLDLSGNEITNKAVKTLQAFTHLQHLSIECCCFTDLGIHQLQNALNKVVIISNTHLEREELLF